MKYFAYGSNMDISRMIDRGVKFSSREYARLNGYRLVFNKKAQKGNFSYANIDISESDFVEGVLYDVEMDGIKQLDTFEGYPKHYTRINVIVIDKNDNKIESIAYIANSDKICEGLYPTSEYINHLLQGKDILSESYINSIKCVMIYNP